MPGKMYDGCYMGPKKKAKTVKRKPLLRETVASRGRPISLPGPDMIPPVLQRTRVHPGFGPRSAQNLNAGPSSAVEQIPASNVSVVERVPASHVSVVKYPFGGNYRAPEESPSTSKTSPKTATSMDSLDRMIIDSNNDLANDLAQTLKQTRIIGHGMEYRNGQKNSTDSNTTQVSPTSASSDANMYSPNVMVNDTDDRLKDLNLNLVPAASTERARNEQFGNPDIQSVGAKWFQTGGDPGPTTERNRVEQWEKGIQTRGGHLPFIDQLNQGVVLRKTTDQKPLNLKKIKDVSILDQIRAGVKLKQVGVNKNPVPVENSLSTLLGRALGKRRAAVEDDVVDDGAFD